MSENEKVWGDLTLQEIAEIVRRCERYGGMAKKGMLDPFVRLFSVSKTIGTERFFEIDYSLARLDNDGETTPWFVNVHYDETTGDQFDFVESHSQDLSTAHKRGRHTPPREAKFKLTRINRHPKEGPISEQAYREILRLNEIYEGVEKAISDRVPWIGVASAVAVPSGQSRELFSLRLAG